MLLHTRVVDIDVSQRLIAYDKWQVIPGSVSVRAVTDKDNVGERPAILLPEQETPGLV